MERYNFDPRNPEKHPSVSVPVESTPGEAWRDSNRDRFGHYRFDPQNPERHQTESQGDNEDNRKNTPDNTIENPTEEPPAETSEAATESDSAEIQETSEQAENLPVPENVERETKTSEQILTEARELFARLEIEGEQLRKTREKIHNRNAGREDEYADDEAPKSEQYERAKQNYLEALKMRRKELFEQAAQEVRSQTTFKTKTEADAMLKEKMKEIIKSTVVQEANLLHDKKQEIQIEQKGPAIHEQIVATVKSVGEKYRKLSWRYKIAVSAGLFGVSGAAFLTGGAAAAAMVSGVAISRQIQRILGGSATFVGLEGAIQKSQEKQAEKKTLEKFEAQLEKLDEYLENEEQELDQRMLELEGLKKKEKWRRYIIAGAAGAIVGSGLIGKAFHNVAEWMGWTHDGPSSGGKGAPDKDQARMMPAHDNTPPGQGDVHPAHDATTEAAARQAEAAPQTPPNFVETVGRGSSVWKMAEHQLQKLYGPSFDNLPEAQKTYAIDAIKDRVAENPRAFGLENIDTLRSGQQIDFSKILNDDQFMGQIFGKANVLTTIQTESIIQNNSILREWVQSHPGERLTSEKVEEILRGTRGHGAGTGNGRTVSYTPDDGPRPEPEAPRVEESKLPTPEQPAQPLGPNPDTAYPPEPAAPTPAPNGKIEVGIPEHPPTDATVTIDSSHSVEASNALHELTFLKTLGIPPEEYNVFKGMRADTFLKQMPADPQEALRLFHEHKINLPHFENYTQDEFERHWQIANLLRQGDPKGLLSDKSIEECLRTIKMQPNPEPLPIEFTKPGGGNFAVNFMDHAKAPGSGEIFEMRNTYGMNFSEAEWKKVGTTTVRDILKQIPASEQEAWAIYNDEIPGRSIDLPHSRIYDSKEFAKHLKLAQFVREHDPDGKLGNLKIKDFMQRNFAPEHQLAATEPAGIAEISPKPAAPIEQAAPRPILDATTEQAATTNRPLVEKAAGQSSGTTTGKNPIREAIDKNLDTTPRTEKFFRLSGGDYKFSYDTQGNPTNYEASYPLADSERLMNNANILNQRVPEEIVRSNFRTLAGNIELYNDMKKAGNLREADYVLEQIRKHATGLEKRFPGIINRNELPDLSKK